MGAPLSRDALGVLGHEIKTPLAAIKSNLDVVLSGDAGPLNPDQQYFLGRIASNLARLGRLVDDLLETAHRPEGQSQLRLAPVDLGPLLAETVRMHQEAFHKARLTWDAGGLPARFPAQVDPVKISQVLTNLLSNAIKYTPPGGTVRIALHEGLPDYLGGRVQETRLFTLEVQDSGPGMDPATLARVFEPFFRGPAAAANGAKGAGLGLHITRQLVQAHGGRIHLESSPGRGTRASVILPRFGSSPGGTEKSL